MGLDVVTLGAAKSAGDQRYSTALTRFLARVASGQTVKIGYLGDSFLEGHTVVSGLNSTGGAVPVGVFKVDDTATVVGATLATRYGVTVKTFNRAVSGHTAADAFTTLVSAPADPNLYRIITGGTADTAGNVTGLDGSLTGADVGMGIWLNLPGTDNSKLTVVATVVSGTALTVTSPPPTAGPCTVVLYASGNVNSTPMTKAVADACDLYVIAYGHNEIKGMGGTGTLPTSGLPLTSGLRYLSAMIRRLKVAVPGDPAIMVAGELPYIGGSGGSNVLLRAYNQAVRDACARHGAQYVDAYTALGDTTGATAPLIDATNHPNKAGHAFWAQTILTHFPGRIPQTAAANPFPLPAPAYDEQRFDPRGFTSITAPTQSGGAGTNRAALLPTTGSGWSTQSALPSTTAQAGDNISYQFAGSDPLLRLDTGPGQGVVNIDVDSIRVYNGYDLGAASASAAQTPIPLIATINGVDAPGPGVHKIAVTLVSGSMTFRGAYHIPGTVEWWGVNTPTRFTVVGGNWVGPTSNSLVWAGFHRSNNGVTIGETLSWTFVGTATGLNILRYNVTAGRNVGLTVDGVSLGNISTHANLQGGSTSLSVVGGWDVVKGLPYGRHDVTLTTTGTTATLQVYAGYAWDETRCERPNTQRGVALVGETVTFASPYAGRPVIRCSPADATSVLPPYPTSPTVNGFVPAGTAGALVEWSAEGSRVTH